MDLSGIVRDVDTFDPLPDIDVCLHDAPAATCARTNANGRYVLHGVPAETEVQLDMALASSDFVLLATFVRTGATSDVLFPGILLFRHTSLDAMLAAAGRPHVAGTGIVLAGALAVQFADPSLGRIWGTLEGATATIDTGAAPAYVADDRSLDPTLTSTGSLGMALFLDVPPGEHTVLVTDPVATCVRDLAAWPGDGDGMRLRVVADTISYAGAERCVAH